MAKTITLEIKKTTCQICANADKRALRKGWRPYCQAKIKRMRNGHCTGFATIKPKPKSPRKAKTEVMA